MAKKTAVWGIDIGQCALKAMRCTLDGEKVVADAFDYIEYPKILSQPEAEPELLINEAMVQFLSRNDVKGDQVVVSVPGQNGLAKFFKPPPVETKKVPDIVKYEARQQIPFELDEVVWDYQMLAGADELDGMALNAEVGLFAMKRDQVYHALSPFMGVDVEVDTIQLSPIAIYNFVTYDRMADELEDVDFDPEQPPESTVILSMGTETTDLVVTNGFRMWQRSIPIGGNHFTKQLTKELKYTFAKAEHLKRNARQAEDPKALFQAMRPVFNDLVTEVQRSLGFFQGIDRAAKIGKVVMMGNAVKLPGLRQYLEKNLGYEILTYDTFQRLDGANVVASPTFKDNIPAFAGCYGLCLQGLKQCQIQTNLMPREILLDRLIEAKKPWAVAGIGTLILGFAFYYVLLFGHWKASEPEKWKDSFAKVKSVKSVSAGHKKKDKEILQQMEHMREMGMELAGLHERRMVWLDLIKILTSKSILPTDTDYVRRQVVNPKKKKYEERPYLYITGIETAYQDDLSTWYSDNIKTQYAKHKPADPNAKKEEEGGEGDEYGGGYSEDDGGEGGGGAGGGPTGKGWIVEVTGHHFFNTNPLTGELFHVKNTILKNLHYGKIRLPVDMSGKTEEFLLSDLGVSFPTMVTDGDTADYKIDTAPKAVSEGGGMSGGAGGAMGGGAMGGGAMGGGAMGGGAMGGGAMGGGAMGGGAMGGGAMGGGAQGGAFGGGQGDGKEEEPEFPVYPVKRHDFVIQFVWQPKFLTQRIELRKVRVEAEAEAKRQAEEAARQQQGGDGQDPQGNQQGPGGVAMQQQ